MKKTKNVIHLFLSGEEPKAISLKYQKVRGQRWSWYRKCSQVL